jgi:hypothetical protein
MQFTTIALSALFLFEGVTATPQLRKYNKIKTFKCPADLAAERCYSYIAKVTKLQDDGCDIMGKSHRPLLSFFDENDTTNGL